MPMGGMAHGIVTLNVTTGIFGTIITVPTRSEFTGDRHRLPMSPPLLPLWDVNLTSNPKPFMPRRRFPASMAKLPFEPGR